MIIKKPYLISIIFSFFISVMLSIIIANRDIYADGDHLVYIYNFSIIDSISNFRYEFLFDLIGYFVKFFTNNYIYYFFTTNIILNLFLLISAYKISSFYKLKVEAYIPLFFGALFFSSWYYTAAFNGLRQGLALALFYISIINLLLLDKKKSFFIFYIASCFFHYSNFLLFPFIFLKNINTSKLLSLSAIIGLFYFLGFNEYIVKAISEALKLPLYASIKNYTDSSDSYRYGFQWDLFIYTIGLSGIYFFINMFILNRKIDIIVRIYIILTIPYYIFGFAGFSNRYGIAAWFFSIFINPLIFYLLFKNNNKLFMTLFTIFMFLSTFYFFGVL